MTKRNPNALRPDEVGRRAARARWGVPRIVRLDELEPPYRRLIVAMIDAAKATAASEPDKV